MDTVLHDWAIVTLSEQSVTALETDKCLGQELGETGQYQLFYIYPGGFNGNLYQEKYRDCIAELPAKMLPVTESEQAYTEHSPNSWSTYWFWVGNESNLLHQLCSRVTRTFKMSDNLLGYLSSGFFKYFLAGMQGDQAWR